MQEELDAEEGEEEEPLEFDDVVFSGDEAVDVQSMASGATGFSRFSTGRSGRIKVPQVPKQMALGSLSMEAPAAKPRPKKRKSADDLASDMDLLDESDLNLDPTLKGVLEALELEGILPCFKGLDPKTIFDDRMRVGHQLKGVCYSEVSRPSP